MKKTISIVMVLAIGMVMEQAKADFTFGTPVNLGPKVNSPADDNPLCLSADGLEMYFVSRRSGGYGDHDVWVTRRITTDSDWSAPENLGPTVNSPQLDTGAQISPDGLTLYISSSRSGSLGESDIWKTTRISKNDPWATPVNIGPPVSSPHDESGVVVSTDGLELYFMSGGRPGGVGDWDMWVAKRPSEEESWSEPLNLGTVVNSTHREGFMCLSPDGLVLFFDSDRPGGLGDWDLWMTRRISKDDPWMNPVNLGPMVNGPDLDALGALAPDGQMLYFCSARTGGFGGFWGDIWQTPIHPVVDLNGDGIVDAADMCIVVDNWGTDNQLCDVGPMPWGDGVVDVEDLIVLAEHLFEEFPPVESVE